MRDRFVWFRTKRHPDRSWNAQLRWKPRDLWIGLRWCRIGNCVDLWLGFVPTIPLHVSWWWSREPGVRQSKKIEPPNPWPDGMRHGKVEPPTPWPDPPPRDSPETRRIVDQMKRQHGIAP